ncbi:hypothetical protein [Providencia rettgeri]|uniref:hypothetical protein n=1 Tax=Providencia rettgeri TaxID=587 RepID=UPI00165800D4|nr:hypothetical protein [Providencia rettgeri]QNP19414.1 hypothetical protein H9L31_16220 [Providencia rettgeri]
MDDRKIPSIYLLNTDLETREKLNASGFNVKYFKLNGYVNCESSHRAGLIPYRHEIPADLHEVEILVIDTTISHFSHANSKSSSVSVYCNPTPSYVDLFPIDMSYVKHYLFSTKKEQAIIVFCDEYTDKFYHFKKNSETDITRRACCTYDFNIHLSIDRKEGTRFKKPENLVSKDITDCIFKYIENSSYKIVFNSIWSDDIILAENETGDAVSIIRNIDNKKIIFLPIINNKSNFLDELFTHILPDNHLFKSLFPSNGTFQWINNNSYITHDEKLKLENIDKLKKDFNEKLSILEGEYLALSNKEENLKTKALLTETDDELVYSVKWFLEYIGFNNVTTPDDLVNEGESEIFEEDLNIETEQKTYLFEIKGIGGTSTDAQCSQISKIVLRREKLRFEHNFKGIYIVNHQRYKDPQERVTPPFNNTQIEDAEMTRRGMTYTYELFQVYHMIEVGILTREDVRAAFDQRGLIDFRKSLNPIKCAHIYPKPEVYSFDLSDTPNITISKNDKIAVRDKDNHWHLLSIESIEVNKHPLEEATASSGGNVGVKVDKFIENAKDFYLKKA